MWPQQKKKFFLFEIDVQHVVVAKVIYSIVPFCSSQYFIPANTPIHMQIRN